MQSRLSLENNFLKHFASVFFPRAIAVEPEPSTKREKKKELARACLSILPKLAVFTVLVECNISSVSVFVR